MQCKIAFSNFSLATDFIGWIFNAVKCDRINIILVDFLNRICLNIPLCVEALFSLVTFVANQLRFFVLFFF